MLEQEKTLDDTPVSSEQTHNGKDPLGGTDQLVAQEVPPGVDRGRRRISKAKIGAAAIMTGRVVSAHQRTLTAISESLTEPRGLPVLPQAKPSVPLDPNLNVVKKGAGPVLTVIDEFYKVGPGPSSSHTIGPMRITYDFYQRAEKLSADKLAKATKLQVNLFGSLSATGKGHGTERAALAGLVGKEPATVDPKFLDSMITKPDEKYPVKLGDKTLSLTLGDVIYDSPKGDFPHPNTMTCKLLAGDKVLLEQE